MEVFMKRFGDARGYLIAFLIGSIGLAATVGPVRADDWPQWLGPQRDGIWRETGIIDRFPEKGPKVRWRTAIGGGYAGPAVAGNRVYVTDRILASGAKNPDNAFGRAPVDGTERVLCLDDASGKIIWKHEYACRYQVSYPAGPRATPVVTGGKVYTLGTMGDLFCLDAESGAGLWSKNFPKDYEAPVPLWGFAGHPLVDGDKLICLVGGPGSLLVAFHKDTGKELWRALSEKEPGYCPPMIFTVDGVRQLILWHPLAVVSLNPETGATYWTQSFRVNSNLTIPTPRLADHQLLVCSFYNGSMMLKLDNDKPGASVLWKGKSNSEQPRLTDGLHIIMMTPAVKDGYIYGVCSYGQLRCLKADTGERLWETMKATSGGPLERWSNAFLVEHQDRFFLFNEKGDLIIARLSPQGYEQLSRAHILDATNRMASRQRESGASVLWSHPAFAHQSMYARNDKEIVCVSLAAEGAQGKGEREKAKGKNQRTMALASALVPFAFPPCR
jgi:outer membrane protein assembly factor BamB